MTDTDLMQAPGRDMRRTSTPDGCRPNSPTHSEAMKTAKRERLLDAAAELVAELGARDLSAKAVYERAGQTRRAFYAMFANVDDCLRALANRASEDEAVAAAADRQLVAPNTDRPAEGRKRSATPVWLSVLRAVKAHPGATTRAIGRYGGISSDWEAAGALSELAQMGLVENANPGCGPNAWLPTDPGLKVAQHAR